MRFPYLKSSDFTPSFSEEPNRSRSLLAIFFNLKEGRDNLNLALIKIIIHWKKQAVDC
jgi:hypothetical protein